MSSGALRELTVPFRDDAPTIPGGAFVDSSFGGAVIGCNFAVRRESYMSIGGFDESLPPYGCDDVEFSIRANKAGLRIGRADSMLVYFRKTDGLRSLIRKTYLSAQAEALVWARHTDLYGARLLPRTLSVGVVRSPMKLVLDLRSGVRPASAIRAAVTTWGNLVGYLRLVRGSRAGEPLLLPTDTATRGDGSHLPVADH